MNYYSHHIGDYRRDTAHLSLLEHGVYRQLLDMYYLSETKIPDETDLVYRRLCARSEEEKRAVDTVLAEFFKSEKGWVHTRCEKEISEYQGKAGRARLNGKLGGRPSKTKVVISGNQENTDLKANHKPLTKNQEPVIPLTPKGETLPGFADFWLAWPANERKQAKGKCFDAWKRAKAEKDAQAIIAHVERLKASEDWRKNGGAYIPAPLVYLNQRRWEGAGEESGPSMFAGAI